MSLQIVGDNSKQINLVVDYYKSKKLRCVYSRKIENNKWKKQCTDRSVSILHRINVNLIK